MTTAIPGYTYDGADLPPSPVTNAELADLERSVVWSDADRDARPYSPTTW